MAHRNSCSCPDIRDRQVLRSARTAQGASPRRGLFASGKFDQYKRDIPYATLAQALQSLVRSLLSQGEAQLSRGGNPSVRRWD